MPEYLAPGVFVEEVSFRAKSIEGVSTTTTGFIGPTRYGPLSVEPELITGMADYERVYGDGAQLVFANRRTRSTTSCGTRHGPSSRTAGSGSTCSGSSRRPRSAARAAARTGPAVTRGWRSGRASQERRRHDGYGSCSRSGPTSSRPCPTSRHPPCQRSPGRGSGHRPSPHPRPRHRSRTDRGCPSCTPSPIGTSSSSPRRPAARSATTLRASRETQAGRSWTLERPSRTSPGRSSAWTWATCWSSRPTLRGPTRSRSSRRP